MVKIDNVIKNEFGNIIHMSAEFFPSKSYDTQWVKITAKGPYSEVEHIWTEFEAVVIKDMLNEIIDKNQYVHSLSFNIT